MTPNEFKAWLDGYLTNRPDPDTALIARKAAEMVGPAQISPWNVTKVPPWPSVPNTCIVR